MTRKHFEMIADILKMRATVIDLRGEVTDQEKHYALYELRSTMYAFGDSFELENTRFDKERFFKACAVQEMLTKYINKIQELNRL